MKMCRVLAAAISLGLLMPPPAHCAEIKFLASNALRAMLQDITPEFERTSGHKLVSTFGSTGNLTASIGKGVPFDLTLLATAALDDLIRQGKLAGPRTEIARSGIGIVYRKGAPKPDISSAAALKTSLLAARSIGLNPQGLSGTHILSVIGKLGIAAEVMPKVRVPPVSAAVDVARGLAEIGMTQIGEILSHTAEGAELAGPLPPEVQLDTIFSIAVAAKAQQPVAAKTFIEFLRSPAIVPVLKAKGLEPG
jgi:molybdate transport system substrate-binding protein